MDASTDQGSDSRVPRQTVVMTGKKLLRDGYDKIGELFVDPNKTYIVTMDSDGSPVIAKED